MNNNKIISIIGSHASEELTSIIERKCLDIQKNGFTFWFFKKNKYCNENLIDNTIDEVYFCLPKIKNTSNDTKISKCATEYSFEGINWHPLNDFSPVTGNMVKNSICFVLESILPTSIQTDLSEYNNVFGLPLKLNQFFSTQIGIKNENKTLFLPNIRNVGYIGKLYKTGFCYIRQSCQHLFW